MKKYHHPNCKCSLCGCVRYETFVFKNGRVCEQCLEFLKDEFRASDPRFGDPL